jgi:Arc/MetJ-type ribon-helix-helix transcriptional regulator
MTEVEINVPEHLEMQIAQMVDNGEFLNREEAIEDLLSTGLKAYKAAGPTDETDDADFEEDGMMGHDDEYVF